MVFDFNKKFVANMYVVSKNFLSSSITKSTLSKVKLEDTEFNKLFNVYSGLEHDAFYILTPSLMEKIKKLEDEIEW